MEWIEVLDKLSDKLGVLAILVVGYLIMRIKDLSSLTGIDLEIYWGPWKIQANKHIDVSISYILLSETDPS